MVTFKDMYYQLFSATVHSFYRKATQSTSTSMTKMLHGAVPQSNWLKKPPCQSPAIGRFPSPCKAGLLILCESSPWSLTSCFSAGAWRQSSLGVSPSLTVVGCWGAAVRADLGVYCLCWGAGRGSKPSFNPKAVGYVFHGKKIILRKSIRGDTEVRFLTHF